MSPDPSPAMRFNVLVVDDSAVMRQMVIRTLKMSGLPLGEVHEAGNGAEGLAQLREHWIDLALVDINMPVMNGEEMIRAVRGDAELAALPVIVVSTERSATRIAEIEALGARFVHKPFPPELLRAAILQLTGVGDDQLPGAPALAGGDLDF